MKDLNWIKHQYAIGQEYSNWESFINDQPNWKVESIMDNICEIHKNEAVNAVLDKVAEGNFQKYRDLMDLAEKEQYNERAVINLKSSAKAYKYAAKELLKLKNK